MGSATWVCCGTTTSSCRRAARRCGAAEGGGAGAEGVTEAKSNKGFNADVTLLASWSTVIQIERLADTGLMSQTNGIGNGKRLHTRAIALALSQREEGKSRRDYFLFTVAVGDVRTPTPPPPGGGQQVSRAL